MKKETINKIILVVLIFFALIRLSLKLYGMYKMQTMHFAGFLVPMSNFGIMIHFLLGPLFYLYVNHRINKDSNYELIHLAHFFPAFVLFLMLFFVEKSFWDFGILRFYYVHLCVYYLMALRSYLLHLRKVQDTKNEYKAIRYSLIILAALMLLYIPILIAYINFVDALLIAGASIYFAFLLLRHKGHLKNKVKYKHSTLDSEKSEALKARIIEAMIDDKLFLDSKLTLQRLCERLGINVSYLSQCINVEFGLSFNDYINSLRIETVKEKLIDPENTKYKISYLAYSSGFESISSFNTAFKKFTGKTPKEYRSEFSKV